MILLQYLYIPVLGMNMVEVHKGTNFEHRELTVHSDIRYTKPSLNPPVLIFLEFFKNWFLKTPYIYHLLIYLWYLKREGLIKCRLQAWAFCYSVQLCDLSNNHLFHCLVCVWFRKQFLMQWINWSVYLEVLEKV